MKLTGSQIIIKLLEKQGISMVAGIPGGSILPLYDELGRSNIRHILVRHEQAAGFIAQGIARTTGKAAVCLATSGPGAMNLLTAIADARSDSIPMVAITGQVNSSLIGTDAFQEADTFGLSFPITKHSILIKKVEELFEAVPKAFYLAESGRPGPVLIDVPRDIQCAEYEFDVFPEAELSVPYVQRFYTPEEKLADLAKKFAEEIAKARKPVLYIGGGTNSPEASVLLKNLLSVASVPVVSSLMGLGVIARTSENFFGMVGMHGAFTANKLMFESDLVLAVGAHFDDRAIGLAKGFCPDAKILHIDTDAAEINKIYTSTYSIVEDCRKVLPLITAELKQLSINSNQKKWLEYGKKIRTEHESFNIGSAGNSVLPNPRKFIAEIPEYAEKAGMPAENLIVSTDVGQHQMWVAQYYPVTRARQLLTSGSLGTMGFGLPAAIGSALANPDKRTVCFSGDGSILMNIQEMATLAELNLPVTVIVFQNGTLGMVRQQQKFLYDRHYSASEFIKVPDFIAIAKGFGITAVEANSDPEWYKKAFTADQTKPCFVLVKIDPEDTVLPYVKAGQANVDALK